MEITNVIAKGPTKDLIVNICNLFNEIEKKEKENFLFNSLRHVSIQTIDSPITTAPPLTHPLQQNLLR